MKKIFTLLSLVLLTCSAAWAQDVATGLMLYNGNCTSGTNSVTFDNGCVLTMTGNADKTWAKGAKITINGTQYVALKNSNGVESTLDAPEGKVITKMTIYSYVNENQEKSGDCYWIVNGESKKLAAFKDNGGDTNPDINTWDIPNLETVVFKNKGKQMQLIIVVDVADAAPALPTAATLADACAMEVEEQHYIMDCDLEVVDYVEMLDSYVITDGATYAVVMLGTECTAGDVVSKGWEAYNDGSGLFIVPIDDVTVTEGEPVNTLPVYAYGEHTAAVAHHQYAKITGVPVTFTDEEADALEDLFIQDIMGILAEGDGLYDIAGMWIEVPGVAPFDEEDPEVTPAVCLFIPMSATKTADTYTVYFNNNSTNWSDVYAYAWDAATDTNLKAWPGTKLETVADGIYTYTFNSAFEPTNIIFNNNAGAQTADLTFENGKTYIFEDALYLRGGWDSSWAATDAWKFETEDNVNYTLTTPAEITKDTQFKVAHADWSKANWGGAGVEPNVSATLKSGDNAWAAAAIPAGAKVTFNSNTGVILFTVPTAIDSIEADAANAVYYNLQGVKVENPAKGNLYIRVAGNKATKVIVK